ncbi:dTTP/UTP pyrophosphatase-like [Argiope bruennichi]|uniref:Putative bifunctional dTTP/UTP like protein n=1 Tax=Argiope bruennichi TaxID=94029 RepID=A0A8T0F5Q3_ARGBR|nr:dTTP/UTP pyrophosphatase-like [Argiope bruennichi]KAF8785648.1 putative bifunctional dTTP/UTP like protein [Argiope bruennichi]
MLSLYSNHLLSRTILLASNSPQRQKILKEIGLSFKVVPSNFAENLDQSSFSSPAEFVKETAKQKALDVAGSIEAKAKQHDLPHLIIAADTVVVLDNKIIGKPKSEEDNIDILKRLSGRKHLVFTGIALIVYDKKNENDPFKYHIRTLHDETDVHMAPLPTDVIEAYVKTGEPANKAGGYAIQGLASTFIEGIKGDYFNVVGLPACKLAKEIYDLCKSSLL